MVRRCRWSWLWRTFSAKEEPAMVPTRRALSIPSRQKNGNAMAYDASVGKAFYKASEKAVGEGFKL